MMHHEASPNPAVVVSALLVVAALVWLGIWLARRGTARSQRRAATEIEVGGERFTVVPSSASADMVTQAGLPLSGSVDVSHLLALPAVCARVPAEGEVDYRPDPQIEWVIDVDFPGRPVLQRPRLLELFDKPWHEANRWPTIHGWSPQTGHWTFVMAGGSPATYTKLAFAWPLWSPPDEGKSPVGAAALIRYRESLSGKLAALGDTPLHASHSPEEAARRATELSALRAECDQGAVVVLAAPDDTPYDARQVWDVLLCLGLEWGDGDIFHWPNPSSEVGDDSLFSVWTTTPPGYFLPQEVAAGRLKPQDLVFGYSIPRSADPLAVFSSMVKAARYAQQRLGGQAGDADGEPLEEAAVEAQIRGVVQRLRDGGFTPGEGATLRVF